MVLGGSLGAVCMMMYWVVARKFIAVDREHIVPILSTLGFSIFVTNSMVVGSIFKSIVVSCGPGSKGNAVGAAKGYLGLGSGLFAAIFNTLRGGPLVESDLDLLPLAAIIVTLGVTVSALAFMPTHAEMIGTGNIVDECTTAHLRLIYTALFALIALILGSTISDLRETGDDDDYKGGNEANYCMTILLVLLWVVPVLGLFIVPKKYNRFPSIAGENLESRSQHSYYTSLGDAETSLLADDNDEESEVEEQPEARSALTNEDSDHWVPRDLKQMLGSGAAWWIAWISIILVGSGTFITNNVGQMAESLALAPSVGHASLALFSVFQAIARVATGVVSESALNWKFTGSRFSFVGVPRTAFFAVASIMGAIAHFTLAKADTVSQFVVGVALEGVGFGMIWPLMVLAVGDIFGPDNLGANYMFFDGASSAIGTLLLSKYLAQTVYANHVDSAVGQEDKACSGDECFRLSHLVVAILASTCVVASILLSRTKLTRSAYQALARGR
jgi:hypothetical protein